MALQFNLLPWREQRRQAKIRRNKLTLFLLSALGFTLGGMTWGWEKLILADYQTALSILEDNNRQITSQLNQKKQLDTLKIKLNHQITAINNLQKRQSFALYLLKDLSQASTGNLYLSYFNLNAGQIEIQGIAKTDRDIAQLITKLQTSRYYQTPHLVNIISRPNLGKAVKQFTITSQTIAIQPNLKEISSLQEQTSL